MAAADGQKKRILIVGAGSSGLTAIKACLEEGQHIVPVCLDKTLDMGGLWNYSTQPSAPGTAGIYDSLVINTCKEMTAFSDFPIPTRFPHFLPHRHVMTYFRMYAQHFRLLPHIRFNTEVRHIRPAEDYDVTGRWNVTYVKHFHKTCPVKCSHLGSDNGYEGGNHKVAGNSEEKTDKEKPGNQGERSWTSQEIVEDQDSANSWEPNSKESTADQRKTVNGQDTAYISKPNGREKTTIAQHKTNGREAANHAKRNGKEETNKQNEAGDQAKGIAVSKSTNSNTANGSETQECHAKTSDQHHAISEEEYTGSTALPEAEDENKAALPGMEETNTAATILLPPGKERANTAVPPEAERPNTAVPPETERETTAPPETERANTAALPQEAEEDHQNLGACLKVTEHYDGVMICTGHHTVPYIPEFLGRAQFQGQILHSHDYKRPEVFRDLRVLIIGFGNSAVDIACDLAKTARQVYLSTRRGSWVLSRSALWGIPADMLGNSRLMASLPTALLQWCVERQANLRIDHDALGLKPRHRALGAHPTFHEELPYHLMTRRVEVRPDVSRILPHGVTFSEGSEQEVDVIIMATGYDYRLDFVDPRVLKVNDNRVKLYKYVFPPRLPHATLAVIGLVQAIGAVIPIAELQSRWFVSLMTGQGSLPQRGKMEKDIAEKEKEMDSRYYRSRRHTLQTFWVQYMDEVATQIGVKPDLWRLLLTSPSLALQCYLGPCLPAQYRLQGPHAWPYAAHFIRSVWSRYAQAHKPRTTGDPNQKVRPTTNPAASSTTSAEMDHPNTLHISEDRASPHDVTNIDVTADVTGNQRRHRNASQIMMTSAESAPPPPYFFSPSFQGREEGEGVCGWCRRVALYLYVLLVALACVVWLGGRFFGPRAEVSDGVD